MKASGLSDRIIEVVIGMNDGLMIPLALSAGMFAAGIDNGHIVRYSLWVITGCGFLMMLGGWLAGRASVPKTNKKKETDMQAFDPVLEEERATRVFLQKLDLDEGLQDMAVADWKKERAEWAELMTTELEKLNTGEAQRPAWQYGALIGLSYILGGLLPILPYFLLTGITSFVASISITLFFLFVLGILKSRAIGQLWWVEGLRYLLLAALAVAGTSAVGYYFFK